ncbi:MAG: tape measure protein [Clostridiaceae bacterium]|nr:tape measure protein [Clostridiaceae bacterium]
MKSPDVVVIDIAARFVDNTSQGVDGATKKVDKFDESIKKAKKQMDTLSGAKANPTLAVRDKATEIISKVGNSLKNMTGKTFSFSMKVIDYATKPLRSLYNFVTSFRGIVTGIFTGYAAKKSIFEPIALADSITNAQLGFETMFKSAEKAQKMMNDINKFAQATPFETEGVITYTQKMIAMGWKPEDDIKDLKVIGDATAGTGKGEEGLERITYALSEIKSKGKLYTQDLNQLASAGIKAKAYIAKGLGFGTDDAGIGKASKMIEDGLIGSDQALKYLLDGMKEFDGLMDKTAKLTVKGLKEQLKDAFKINMLSKWGEGLRDGVKNGLSKVVDFVNTNEQGLIKLGDRAKDFAYDLSTRAVTALGKFTEKLLEITNTDAFKNANMGGKIKILWGDVIAKPFDEWWNGSGKAWLAKTSGNIGYGIGSAIKGGVVAILGITQNGAVEDGVSIGKSFAEGFLQGFDAGKVSSAIFNSVKQSGKDVATGKGTAGDWIMSALALYGIVKGGKGIRNILFGKPEVSKGLVGGIKNIGQWFKGGATGAAKATDTAVDIAKAVKTADVATDIAGAAIKTTPILDQYGNVIKTVTTNPGNVATAAKAGQYIDDIAVGASKAAPALGKVGKFFKGNWLGLAFAGLSIASAEDKKKETVKQVGGFGASLAGAKLGALAGTAIAPGIGSLIGGAIGGIGGYIGGEAFGEWVYSLIDYRKTQQKELAKIGQNLRDGVKDYEAFTAASGATKDLVGEYKALSQAIENGRIPSEELAYQQERLLGIASILQQTFPDIISQYDAENGKVKERLGLIEKEIQLMETKEKMKLTQQVEDTKARVPQLQEEIGILSEQTQKLEEQWTTAHKLRQGLTDIQTEWEKGNKANENSNGFVEDMQASTEKANELIKKANELAKTLGFDYDYSGAGFAGIGFEIVDLGKKTGDLLKQYEDSSDKLATAKKSLEDYYTAATTLIQLEYGANLTDGAEKITTLAGASAELANNGKLSEQTLSGINDILPDFATNTGTAEEKQALLKKTMGEIAAPLQEAAAKVGALNSELSSLPSEKKIKVEVIYNQTGSPPRGAQVNALPNANGNIIDRPTVALMGEAGPEAIIPLSSGKKDRAISLWEKAGQMLGVTPFANGGIVGRAVEPVNNAISNILKGFSVTVPNIEIINHFEGSTADPESIMQVLNDNIKGISNKIALQMANDIVKIFANLSMEAEGVR